MANKPGIFTREETLALVSALILTTILCVYSLYLKQQELAGTGIVSLFEYAESFDVPGKFSGVPRHKARQVKRESLLPTKEVGIQVGGNGSSSGDTTTLTHLHSIAPSDSLSRTSGTISDSISVEPSIVFRPYKRSWELDSILKTEGEAGASLLREHLFHESRAYDTLLTNHLIRLRNEFTRFDTPPTLKEDMERNIRRYGVSHNPIRPQPPSAQVPLEGIVIPVLDFLYSKSKEVPAAISRLFKRGQEKASE